MGARPGARGRRPVAARDRAGGRRRRWRRRTDRDSFYAGIGGLAPALAEIARHRALTDEEQALAHGIVARLSAQARVRTEPSLYDGLAGDAVALRLLAPGSETVALDRLVELMTPAGWDSRVPVDGGTEVPQNDLVGGTAGIVLAAVWAGGDHARTIATTGGEALLAAADTTEAGLDWPMVRDWPAPDAQLLARHRRGRHRAGRRGPGAGTPGLRRRRRAGRPAPARRRARWTTAGSWCRTRSRRPPATWSR